MHCATIKTIKIFPNAVRTAHQLIPSVITRRTAAPSVACYFYYNRYLSPKNTVLGKKKKEFTDYGAMFVTFTSYVGHQVWCEAALPCVGFKILWAVNSK